MSRKSNRKARAVRMRTAREVVNEAAVTQEAINTKLAQWLEINELDLCANHRKEVIYEEFQLFEELMTMARADPELAVAMAHYKTHPVGGNRPYTGCTGEVRELATRRWTVRLKEELESDTYENYLQRIAPTDIPVMTPEEYQNKRKSALELCEDEPSDAAIAAFEQEPPSHSRAFNANKGLICPSSTASNN